MRRQVAFDRLLARLSQAASGAWVLKGGYAMELRFRTARATKDLDFTLRTAGRTHDREEDQLLAELQEAAAAGPEDFFSFQIGEATADLDGAPYGGSRHPVEVRLGGRAFAKFHIDLGLGDVVLDPTERVQCRDWLGFAEIPSPAVEMISREQQFAEKLHAYTLPRTAAPNSRVRDLVDMVLLVQSGTLAGERTSEAIKRTFERRATHTAPRLLSPPSPDWDLPFAALARECGLGIDLAAGFTAVEDFYLSL